MRFLCPCGHLIRDTADGLAYKARLIPDQTWLELQQTPPLELSDGTRVFREDAVFEATGRIAYQCESCGRLLVLHNGKQHWFVPESPVLAKDVLRGSPQRG